MSLPLPYPFDLGFMQRALVACLAVGFFAPMIGVYLVQKRMSLIGDGIGHIAFAGVGAGVLAGIAPMWTALAFAVVGALAVEWFRTRRQTSGDVALAMLFYSGIALGVVLISLGDGLNAGVLTYLFGQPLTVTTPEAAGIVGLGLAVAVGVFALRWALFSVVTDEDWSRVAGLPVGGLNTVLAVLTAITVVAAMQVVGILLVAAMMVLPVAAAQQLARSFRGTMWIAVGIGSASAVAGLGLSRTWGLASGGTIVLVVAGVFLLSSLLGRLRRRRMEVRT